MSTRSTTPITLTGPWREPVQMLAEQRYAGHSSVHDAASAARLGLKGAPIEGPTHFSQFEPLALAVWGDRWLTQGCISAHFLNMVIEGEQVQAELSLEGPGTTRGRIFARKADGTPVLEGTASVGPQAEPTALGARLAQTQARDPGPLFLLDQLRVGQSGPEGEFITVGADDHLGELYPFSLRDKLTHITERVDVHQIGADTPWGAAVMPFEMLSVLTNAHGHAAGFVARQPSMGLFIDLEVSMLAGPVLVGRRYGLKRELVALSQSRRTESFWTRTTLLDGSTPVAEVLLHQGVFKDSHPDYPHSPKA